MNKRRSWEIDALRGLMLLLMTVTHLPTRLTSPLGQPFGFVSAAEGFVLLSAYVSGLVYSRLAYREGIEAMRGAFWRRALKVYLCQAATLLFLFSFIAALGLKIDQPAVKDLMSYYLHEPYSALAASLLLVYQPPLLDILPLYILFMLASPWVLAWAMRHGWQVVLFSSFALWLGAQFGLGNWVYLSVAGAAGVTVPISETGAFVTLAWQLLWVVGLWMGASRNLPGAKPITFPTWALTSAAVLALIGLVWRHVEGQAAFGENMALNLLFDKWTLGPLRLLNLLALCVVTLGFGPLLARHFVRQRWLQKMGAASLPVFCAHLVVVLLVLAVFGSNPFDRPWWLDGLLLAGCFAVLYAVAVCSAWFDERSARQQSGPACIKARPVPLAAGAAEVPVRPKL